MTKRLIRSIIVPKRKPPHNTMKFEPYRGILTKSVRDFEGTEKQDASPKNILILNLVK